ncbi:MAG: hypothetical protein K2M82_04655 [Lachnospiraceae bacterium]|nr:hypothetical protein [Lachnospiraceae bacterium]
MKYPCLILKSVCKTPVNVTVYREGISEDGEPLTDVKLDLMCNYQDKAKTVITADKQLVQLTAQAYFIGDIAPDLPTLAGGEVEVYGIKRRIFQGEKARNPDGSVNFTRLDLM